MAEETIPSIVTILQCTDFLSAPNASAKVVRVGETFAVKYDRSVDLLGAQNLSYVASHSNVPVPKVYVTLLRESTNRKFIIMEFVHGEMLAQAWPNLTAFEKENGVDQLREALSELRKVPSAGTSDLSTNKPVQMASSTVLARCTIHRGSARSRRKMMIWTEGFYECSSLLSQHHT